VVACALAPEPTAPTHTDFEWLHLGDQCADPVAVLALAVLARAIQDRAWNWLLDPADPGAFGAWCAVAEVEPVLIRRAVRVRHGGVAGPLGLDRAVDALARRRKRPPSKPMRGVVDR
jgi:hypothetical protein